VGLVAVFPGSFDPLTVAHIAIADAARTHLGAGTDVRIDLAMSIDPLGKEAVDQRPLTARRAEIETKTAHLDWIGVTVREARLVVDLAAGYDRVVVGADKWRQLHDPRFYADEQALVEAMRRLCPAVVFRRPGHDVQPLRPGDVVLDLPLDVREVSSTAVRAGRHDWRY
jgi:nicotinic acid mononucleotide adenylyltransferase